MNSLAVQPFEIWIGFYDLKDGSPPPEQPLLLATVGSVSFKTACLKYELGTRLEYIMGMEQRGQEPEPKSCEWFYDIKTNRNQFTGHYFETEEDAWATFPKRKSIIISHESPI